MPTLKQIKLQCPVCDHQFVSSQISNVKCTKKHTDFHEVAVGLSALPHMVHSCPSCGYTRRMEENFHEPLAQEQKLAIRENVTAKLPTGDGGRRPASSSERYELAALTCDVLDHGPRIVADLFLRAAWCCVEEGDVEAERYFRRLAAMKFEEALMPFSGFVEDRERPVLIYLVGELWRRVGDLRKANDWFDAAMSIKSAEQWVRDLAKQQKNSPREYFG